MITIKTSLALISIFLIVTMAMKSYSKAVVKSQSHNQSTMIATPDRFSSSSSALTGRQPRHNLRIHPQRRDLVQTSQYDAQIFLELQYVTDNVAIEMETLDPDNPTIVQFCRAVQQQVRTRYEEKSGFAQIANFSTQTHLIVFLQFSVPGILTFLICSKY